MNQLSAGFARVNITPELGIRISGYFIERIADGVLDELEINAVAVSDGSKKAVLMSVDSLGLHDDDLMAEYRKYVAEKAGIPYEAVFIASTHTHTGPEWSNPEKDCPEKRYANFMKYRLADAAVMALNDLKPAKLGWAIGKAEHVAFVRRYRMKNGEIHTNPGVDNPDIVGPIGDVDERVNVIRLVREGADEIVIANMGLHPDVIGSTKISADWPGFTRRRVEKALDNVKCVFFNGAQGDINHVNVHPRGGDLNDMFMDFDDVSRGYGHSRHIGNVMAGAVLSVYDKVKFTEADTVNFAEKIIDVPSNMPDPKDIPEARHINELHTTGRDAELPYKGMMLTTKVAEAARMLRLEHGPASFKMVLSALSIGGIVFLGVPGEPFTGIGRGLKEAEGWELVCPCCLVNGDDGYFPMQEAYDEGGYETGTSRFKAGVAELLIAEGKKLADSIK